MALIEAAQSTQKINKKTTPRDHLERSPRSQSMLQNRVKEMARNSKRKGERR
jgi:hypothetical protein